MSETKLCARSVPGPANFRLQHIGGSSALTEGRIYSQEFPVSFRCKCREDMDRLFEAGVVAIVEMTTLYHKDNGTLLGNYVWAKLGE